MKMFNVLDHQDFDVLDRIWRGADEVSRHAVQIRGRLRKQAELAALAINNTITERDEARDALCFAKRVNLEQRRRLEETESALNSALVVIDRLRLRGRR